ncbi:MAG: cytochrome c peroxidase [Crocinitomicaceae bacterium]
MKSKTIIFTLVLFAFMGAGIPVKGDLKLIEIPANWPDPVYDFKKNPLSEKGIALGRFLFYDPILSRDSTISCSSCHLSFTAFTHVDHALSHGIEDRIGIRNSPVLINLAWNKSFMWDGAVNHIEVQPLAPISNPLEMDESLQQVAKKLSKNPFYKRLFNESFGDNEITGERILLALAQFQLTLISSNSKYDKVQRGELEFSEQEAKGYQLFRASCASCHQEPLFTNGGFANNGLPVDTILNDIGRMKISLNPSDSLKFKVPTLRNIEFSFPYMHDGRFKSLRQVLDHYEKGIQPHPTLNPEMKSIKKMSKEDKVDLLAFLLTLSDKEFLFNPKFGFPRKNFNPSEGYFNN